MENKGAKIFVLSFFIIVFAYIFISRELERRQLKFKPIFTKGRIGKFDRISKRSACSINYTFNVNGVEYNGSKTYNIEISNANEFMGKEFAIVYSQENVENSQLLLTKDDYKTFGLIYPDSLYWVESLVLN